MRTKCLSTTTTVTGRAKENQLPRFTFGAGGKGPVKTTSNPSGLDECFTDSPPQEKNVFGNLLPVPQRPRMLQNSASFLGRVSASPLNGLARRSAAPPIARPRKQFRRSLSMFEHPGDVMKSSKQANSAVGLDSVMDVDEEPCLKLPNFISEDRPDSLPRISQDTMISVLNGEFGQHFARTMVIDCRFEYEYEGGHIDGAKNFNDKEKLSRELFDPTSINEHTLIVLHCEYSAHRAPLM
jgi:hypothetical protein